MKLTLDMIAKDVAEKALDEFIYEGKTIREWVEIIVKQQPCEDCISREKVFEQISCWVNSGEYRYTNATYYLTRRIQGISSVTPQPKTGHWIRWYEQKENDRCIEHIPHCKCSECGKEFNPHTSQFVKFCPNCGAEMEGEEC